MQTVNCPHCDKYLCRFEKAGEERLIIVHCTKCDLDIEINLGKTGLYSVKDVQPDIDDVRSTWPWPDIRLE